MAPQVRALPSVIRGKNDVKEYRAFELDNGVTCMVVHDGDSKTTGVACSVSVGAAADPRSLPGLAHFVEHMCFMGSARYPNENHYKQFLSSHGGRSNASTSLYYTTYKFEILQQHAEEAIDVFSQFFVAPLFTADATSREVQAVDSENSKNLVSDARRRLQAIKDLADPHHYYSKFTTGNAVTLRDGQDRDALLAFHQHHYTPQNMTVVVVGPQSLDTLQQLIVPRFGAIQSTSTRNHGTPREVQDLVAEAARDMPQPPLSSSDPVYKPAFRPSLQNHQWPVLVTLQPVRSSLRTLSLAFPLPPTQHMFNSSPTRMLSHLLGHEGHHSPFAILQTAGLITSLSAGSRISDTHQSLFQIEVQLTQRGEDLWQETVVPVLFHHMGLVREAAKRGELGPVWDEMKRLGAIMFDYPSSRGVSAYSFAPSLAQSIQRTGTQQCLSAGSLLEDDPPELLVDFCNRLQPENCFVERLSPQAWQQAEARTAQSTQPDEGFGKRTEPWYDIEYCLETIDRNILETWKNPVGKHGIDLSELALPQPNQFVPRSMELCAELPEEAKAAPRIQRSIDPPNLLSHDSHGRLWHRLDDRYALPQSQISFLMRTQYTNHDADQQYSAHHAIHSSLLTAWFTQVMAQTTYDAELARLHWSLAATKQGLKLTCSGFSDRLSDLGLMVLREFVEGSCLRGHGASMLEPTRDRLVRNLRGYLSSGRADVYAAYYSNFFMSNQNAPIEESIHVALTASSESLLQHHANLLHDENLFVECLYAGNVSSSVASDFYNQANQLLRKSTPAPVSVKWMPGNAHIRTCHFFLSATMLIMLCLFFLCLTGYDERRLESGQSVELHFSSQNPSEENGAVLVTFQSQIPGFKGDKLSVPESLESTASIRLLCHMLREPLYNELRTKQQLGYVVQSYYDREFSTHPSSAGPMTTPVDLIAINIMSRKVSPPEVAERVDDFLASFRTVLETMPESEIRSHADALSENMMKPIQSLSSEVALRFGRIRYYSPELVNDLDSMPWESVPSIARAVTNVSRQDLLSTLDRVVLNQNQRSRVLSLIYGKTFPLDTSRLRTWSSSVVVNDLEKLVRLRSSLDFYDNSTRKPKHALFQLARMQSAMELYHKSIRQPGETVAQLLRLRSTWTAVAVVGVGVAAGLTLTRNKKG